MWGHDSLFHLHNWQRFSVPQWNLLIFDGCISFRLIKGRSAQSCAHLQAREARLQRSVLAGFENQAANPAARPLRMYEERSNLCRMSRRVKERVFSSGILIATIQGLARAPSTDCSAPSICAGE